MAETHAPAVYKDAGGDRLVVGTGGRFIENLTPTNITTAGAGTYTANDIAGGLITRDPSGAGRTDTTATAVAIIAACGLDNDGDCVLCRLVNTADAAEAITLAGGDGVTIANVGQTLAQNESALMLFRRTSATAVTLYLFGA